MSVPRIELMAAVLGTRLGNTIIKDHDLEISEVYYWTDSSTVLSWVHSDPMDRKQFVTYRVGEIQESSKIENWRYVPTKLNPADLATKVMSKPKLESQHFWFAGPEFLSMPRNVWPKQNKIEDSEEERRKPDKAQFVNVQIQVENRIIDANRFSKWERLLRSIAYVGRYLTNLHNKVAEGVDTDQVAGGLTTEELQWSFNCIIKHAQREMFGPEIAALKADNNYIIPKSSALFKLSPYIDEDGLLRMHSRIERAEFVDYSTRNPIILKKYHRITILIVDWYHRKFKHVNHETAINEIFQTYKIPGMRQLLGKVRKLCQTCKVRNARPQPPQMASLPIGRMSPFCMPFTHVGLDFFGPFLSAIGRRTEKRYGVVFTCLTCRAVHIEMAFSLTMSSCNMVIRNFIARRGTPRVFYSDNGTNLRAAERELRESLAKVKFGELEAEFTSTETSWVFIPPASPHMGGAWERMIHSIKHVLYQIVTPGTKLNDEKLLNLFMEVESIVNSRPLTYLSLETADQEVLTPNHFLLGSSNGQKPPGEFNEKDQFVRNVWRHSQYLANQFWKRWVAEMLPTLTGRTAWFQRVEPIQVGDVAVIVDPNSPRYSWPKGILVAVRLAKDGQVRSATIQTANGVYERPATKIAILDVKAPDDGIVK